MVLGLFRRNKKKNLILDELNQIKERVTQTENEIKSLESTMADELKKVYGYISQIYDDVDAVGEVVHEIKEKVSGLDEGKLATLEKKISEAEGFSERVNVIGRVVLKDHERINKLEAQMEDVLKAIDRLVAEIKEESQAKMVEVTPAAKVKEKSSELKKEKKTKASAINKTDYLAELRRLRKELLELKSTA